MEVAEEDEPIKVVVVALQLRIRIENNLYYNNVFNTLIHYIYIIYG